MNSVIVIASILGGISTFLFCVRCPPRRIANACSGFSNMLRGRKQFAGFFDWAERYFRRTGAKYHYGKDISPTAMLFLSLVVAGAGIGIFSRCGVVQMLLAGAVFALLPWGLLPLLNQRDNERMLPEIKLLYHALEMQIRSGVYVTDALAEIYLSVRNKRLKDALLELSGSLLLHADLQDALEEMQGKFVNPYIDALCITLLQAMDSGQAVDLLQDIGGQVRDMEASVLGRKKAALDRSLTFYQLAMLSATMLVTLYACVSYMLRAAAANF